MKFYNLAEDFCRYLSETEINDENADALISRLMRLYLAAQELPDTVPDDVDCSAYSRKRETPNPRITCQDFYLMVFDPRKEEEPVGGALTDDLTDIASDLLNGMASYDAGLYTDAIWDWKFDFETHWGKHAVDAIRFLHEIATS